MNSNELSVLFVDDNSRALGATSELLKFHGAKLVHVAVDGEDALRTLDLLAEQNELPDCIVTDCHMPKVDGMDLIQRIKSDARIKHIPIIMLSGRLGQLQEKMALELGAKKCLKKPIMSIDLFYEIKAVVKAQV